MRALLLSRISRATWAYLRYYLSGIYRRVDEHHAFLMSGGLAFSLFVCIVPLVLVVFAVLSNLFERPTVAAEISGMIDRVVPYPEYAASVKQFIAARLERTADLKQVAGAVGAIGLLFAASSLFSSLRTILNTVFKTSRPESVVVGKLWDFGMIILVLTLFVALILALPAIETATELAKRADLFQPVDPGLGQGLVLVAISFVALVLAFSAVYWLVPVKKPALRTVLVSAGSASTLWLLAKELFGYYIGHMATLKHIYGVYAFLIVAAFWIYYSALALILGAEIGQLYADRRNGQTSS